MASVALVTWLAFVGGTADAASHSDAPLIKQDPQANLTDVYAFVGPSTTIRARRSSTSSSTCARSRSPVTA